MAAEANANDPRPVSPPPSILTNGDGASTDSSQSSTALSIPPPLWTHRVSASFNAMADQIAAASQAIAQIPPLPDSMFANLSSRIEAIERTQERLEADLQALRNQIGQITEGPEKFEKALNDHIEAFKLEQKRLPARLHNAMVTVPKIAIKPIIMANGKFPQNFPATRGEFEHLTKERYEFLLQSYGQPITGDTAAKRDAVRAFIGLPQ